MNDPIATDYPRTVTIVHYRYPWAHLCMYINWGRMEEGGTTHAITIRTTNKTIPMYNLVSKEKNILPKRNTPQSNPDGLIGHYWEAIKKLDYSYNAISV